MPITGKTVVITGGSRGIGLGLVKKFLSRGNTVIATSREGSKATHLQQLRGEYPERLRITDLNIALPANVAAWAEGVKVSGVKGIDLLINNAGVYGRRLSLAEFEEEDFLFAFQSNTLGPYFVVQQLLKQGLLGAPSGLPDGSLVVNMSSIMASNTEPTISAATPGGFPYRASKAALNVISTTLARDLAPSGVQVVAMHPGYVRTDMTGGNGFIEVEESTTGILAVLESGVPLSGRFMSYTGEELPW